MAKSWLDVQVDLELSRFQQGRQEEKQYGDDITGSSIQGSQSLLPSIGPEGWPCHVLDQQPRDLPSLLQKLHSRYKILRYVHITAHTFCPLHKFSFWFSEIVHVAVSRACKEQHRQIEVRDIGDYIIKYHVDISMLFFLSSFTNLSINIYCKVLEICGPCGAQG